MHNLFYESIKIASASRNGRNGVLLAVPPARGEMDMYMEMLCKHPKCLVIRFAHLKAESDFVQLVSWFFEEGHTDSTQPVGI